MSMHCVKCPNTEFFLVRIFVSSDTFHAVMLLKYWKFKSTLAFNTHVFENVFFFFDIWNNSKFNKLSILDLLTTNAKNIEIR